jgi:hypothetical protein
MQVFKDIFELPWLLTQQMLHQWNMSQIVKNTIIMWML